MNKEMPTARTKSLLKELTGNELPETTTAYVHGSCLRNPGGRIGSAYLILHPDGDYAYGTQAFISGTNMLSDAYALLMAFKALDPSSPAVIATDSTYLEKMLLHVSRAPLLPKVNRAVWEVIRPFSRRPAGFSIARTSGALKTAGIHLTDTLAVHAAANGPWIDFPYPKSLDSKIPQTPYPR